MSYSYGGSDIGDLYRIDLDGDRMEVVKSEGNGFPVEEKTYTLAAEAYGEIAAILENCKMKSWTNLPKATEFAMDEATLHFSVTLMDGTVISAGSGDEIPEGGGKAIRAIRDILEKYMQ